DRVSYGEGFWGPDNNFYFSIMTRQLADEFLNKGLDLKTAEGYPLSYVKFDPSKPYMIPKD
ncbi:MAG TPA: hypothetical protein VL947_08040, partial [Cytophagales bacterium]|nr:hypothetical protein [Cytophagales bacterium]